MRGNVIWPHKKIWAGRTMTIEVVVKRPGWISWLTGCQPDAPAHGHHTSGKLAHSYVTVCAHAPLRVSFNHPVSAIFYGPSQKKLVRHVLPAPTSVVTLHRSGVAGSIWISGLPVGWGATRPQLVELVPLWLRHLRGGLSVTRLGDPATLPITLTFSKTVAAALGKTRAGRLPATPGTWQPLNSHTIKFDPDGLRLRARGQGEDPAARRYQTPRWSDHGSERIRPLVGAGRLDGAPAADVGQPGVSAGDGSRAGPERR